MEKAPTLRIIYRFPWLAIMAATLEVIYLFLLSQGFDWSRLGLSQLWQQKSVQFGSVGITLSLILGEFLVFATNKKLTLSRLDKFNTTLTELYQTRQKMQNKLHKYSDHTDKLKLFISERLLEHLEYDEKYLHFKNIASEVRHNGIISYDRVHTALTQAAKTAENKKQYIQAIEAMHYLWDLLDLSTADNIAMYIADKLYQCEEQYYRQRLEETSNSPFSPTFDTRKAIHKTMENFIVENGGKLESYNPDKKYIHYQDKRYWIHLEPCGELLGTENHIVLLIENLITNALYYVTHKRYKNRFSHVALRLKREGGHAHISVYNNGPTIDAETRKQLFTLGFTTKRKKGHNGKGLGLYFVNEIVKGYEGKIEVENITNTHDSYIIRIESEGDEKITELVETNTNSSGQPICAGDHHKEASSEILWRFNKPIRNVEITIQSNRKTVSLNKDSIKAGEKTYLMDPTSPDRPGWMLEIEHLKTVSKVSFRPIDIRGVCFHVRIPTAEFRLDPDYYEMNAEELDSLQNVDVELEEIQPFIS